MHALICRQSRKLGFASDSALGDGSLPALHDESLVSISVPARKNFPPAICYKSKRIYLQGTVRILNSYDIVIKQPEKSPVHSSYNTREAFVMRCRQTVTTKHIVRGFAEFVRLVTNKCMHRIENATVFLSLYRKFSGVSYNITYIYYLLSTLISSSVKGRHSPFLRLSGRVRGPMEILLR